MGYFGKGHEEIDTTDEESGVNEIADILRNVDIRTVSSTSANQGFETSFLMIEGRPQNCTDEDDEGFPVPKDETWKANWLCRPYKRERLWEEIYAANHKGIAGHAAVLNTLKNTGIMIFIIDSKVSTTTADVLDSIRNVLHHVCKEERALPGFSPKHAQRCLLYRDTEGRFFNLLLDDYSAFTADSWESNMKSFSCLQAVSLLMVLCRSFACVTQQTLVVEHYEPAYFALLLGLIFKEEISFSWTNVAMMIRGFPSLSACSIITRTDSDWLRKTIVFALLLASIAGGSVQHVLCFLGISLACLALLANLGSRAWGFMEWKPIQSFGILEPIMAFFAAVLTGIAFPFLGHRQVQSGGKAALESLIGIALLSAIIFIISDYDDIQKFVIIGSENCSQDFIVLAVGAWWSFATICSLITVYRKGRQGIWPDEEEPLLVKDHRSPIGFRVPNLPDFPIDTVMAERGWLCLGIQMEFFLMLTITACMGGFLLFLPFTDVDDNLHKKIAGSN